MATRVECYPLTQTEDEHRHICSNRRDCRQVAPILRRVMLERMTVGPVRIPQATHCCVTPSGRRKWLRRWLCAECARQWCKQRHVPFPESFPPLVRDKPE